MHLTGFCVGDGEPDRDFPALGSEKLLSDFNLDEYCICVVEGRRPRSGTGGARAGTTTNTATDNSMSTFSPALPSTGTLGMAQSASAGQLRSVNSFGLLSSAGGSTTRTRDDTGDTFVGRKERARSSSKQSYDSFQNTVSCLVSFSSVQRRVNISGFILYDF